MAKITPAALKKRGWIYSNPNVPPTRESSSFWYFIGNNLPNNGYSYRLDKYPNCDIFILDLPYPNSDIGGWFSLREVNTLKQLDDLIKALEVKI
jgi:hypothetical protein